MASYCIFLGHQPSISMAELIALLPDCELRTQWSPQIVTIETKSDLTQEWLATLGGTVLIAKQLPGSPDSGRGSISSLEKIIPPMLFRELKDVKRKALFSFRTLNVPRNIVRTLYKTCKRELKQKEVASRYIGNERNPAKPGTLLLRGIPGPNSCEIVILHDPRKKTLWIGKTCAVQDVQAYTTRDMEKPFRDTKTGLLPPKLAQIMLNLGLSLQEESTPDKITVWDPFCGSGVIALEALLRRMHVLASDKSERAVKGAKTNVQWLRSKEKTPKAITSTVWKHNALKPTELEKTPSLIVTETTLGPALKAPPTKRDATALIRDAEQITHDFFQNIAELLPTVPVVCTLPVYHTRDGSKLFLSKALDRIQKLGYQLRTPHHKFLNTTDRSTLLYARPDQFVGREIICVIPGKSLQSQLSGTGGGATAKASAPKTRPKKKAPKPKKTKPRKTPKKAGPKKK